MGHITAQLKYPIYKIVYFKWNSREILQLTWWLKRTKHLHTNPSRARCECVVSLGIFIWILQDDYNQSTICLCDWQTSLSTFSKLVHICIRIRIDCCLYGWAGLRLKMAISLHSIKNATKIYPFASWRCAFSISHFGLTIRFICSMNLWAFRCRSRNTWENLLFIPYISPASTDFNYEISIHFHVHMIFTQQICV